MERTREDEALWAAHKTGCREARARLIADHVPLVHYLARRIHHFPGGVVGHEDLVGFGMIGLIDAVDRFDPDRGVPFATFASPRIRGAIQDELRRVDWLPRRLRRRVKGSWSDPGPPSPSGDPAWQEAVAARARRRLLAELPVQVQVSLEAPVSRGRDVEDPREGPAALAERDELHRLLETSLSELTERERRVLGLSFGEGWSLLQIAAELGVSQGRVSQIRTHALRRLRRRLERAGVTQAPPPSAVPAPWLAVS